MQKLQLAYHLTLDCEQLRTSLLDAQMALIELHLCAHLREAWTDVGGVGVAPRLGVALHEALGRVHAARDGEHTSCT